jgi:hypothetical protein
MGRRGIWTLALVALVGASCSGPPSTRGRAPSPAVSSITFSGPFQPQEVLATGGKAWLVGQIGSPAANRCAVERLDPRTLRTASYPLPECGPYATAGGGHLYLTALQYLAGTNSAEVHIESLDTATGHAVVMAPVVTTPVGSDVAHMALAYGGGSLWLYTWTNQLVKVSPVTGAVLDTIPAVPVPGGATPAVVANPAGVWVAAGPGGDGVLGRIPPGSRVPVAIYNTATPGSIRWLAAAGDRVWADAVSYLNGGRTAQTRLVGFDLSGRKVVETAPEDLGSSLVPGTGNALWSLGVAGPTCSGPQRLWKVDGSTGRSTTFTTLRSPVTNPCLNESSYQLAVAAGFVFVLDPTSTASLLYRINE